MTTTERHPPVGLLLRLIRVLLSGPREALVALGTRHGALLEAVLELDAPIAGAADGGACAGVLARAEGTLRSAPAHVLLAVARDLLRGGLETGGSPGSLDAWRQELLEAELVGALAEAQGDTRAREFAALVRLAFRPVPEPAPAGTGAAYGLVRDLQAHVDGPTAALEDAHPLLCHAHVARRAVRGDDPEGARRAFEQLFGVPAIELRERLTALGHTVDEDVAAARVAEAAVDPAALAQPLGRLQRLAAQLEGPLEPEACLARCAALYRTVVGGRLHALHADPESARLAGAPGSALADFVLGIRPPRTRVAGALAGGGTVVLRPEDDDLAVGDRQLLRIVGDRGLIAVPFGGEGEPGAGVLLAALPPAGASGEGDLLLRRLVLEVCVHGLDRAAAEDRRRQRIEADYLAASERRLREVVHEANNPLGIVQNYLHILGLRLKDEETGREQLRMIGEEIRRTGDIIRGLLEVPFALDGGTPPEAVAPISVNGLVAEQLGILDAALLAPARVDVRLDLDGDDADLALDGDKLRQVLSNLVRNAVEAMAPRGGSLRVGTRTRVLLQDRRFVEIVVSDTGPGISAEIFDRLFEPKDSPKGGGHEGLGLPIVKQLVEALGGRIACETRTGEGTTFRVLLPADGPSGP